LTNLIVNGRLDPLPRQAGIKGIKLYDGTRHSFATQFVISNKGNITTLQNILGHTDLRTTMKYTHASVDAMREAMER
jgi:site-specific recombinase XerD